MSARHEVKRIGQCLEPGCPDAAHLALGWCDRHWPKHEDDVQRRMRDDYDRRERVRRMGEP